mgnify:CR=1 FL=1
MRSAAMLVAVAAAYVLLRGHPEPWPGVVRACLAVLALVAGLGLWGRRGSGRGASLESRRPVSWLDYGAIGLAVLACECGFLVFLSAAPKPLESVALRFEEWLRPAVALERRQQRPAGEARPGNWLFQGDKKFRRLPMRTDLRQGNRPEIFLQPASEADVRTLLDSRVYVQAFALSQYGDGTWSAFPGGAEGLEADKDGWLRFAGRGGPVVACRVFQGLESSGQNPLVGLQGMVAARVPEVTRFDDGLALLPEGMARFGGFRYDTLSSPLSLDELDAGAVAAGVAEPEVPAEWLALPGGPLGRELAALAELASGEGPVVERLRGIRNHLRTTHEYSLTTENPEGRDPLENFLLHEQKGHCEHFATAGALMARACGVPSRIAYGWVGGTYYESSRTFVFRAREAHAWAEVWIRGRGWVVLDPTPAATPRWTQPEVAPPAAPAIDWPEWTEGDEKTDRFWDYVELMLPFTTPHPDDAGQYETLAALGIGEGFDMDSFEPAIQDAIRNGVKDAWAEYAEAGNDPNVDSGKLFASREKIGDDYLSRTLGVVLGIFGNVNEQAVYFSIPLGADGQPLDASKNNYSVTFPAGETPPVKYFWSFTMYRLPERWLVGNPIDRYSLSSTTPGVKQNEDGSTTIYFQHESPGPEKESNWLPTPDGPFWTVLRNYGPDASIINGTYPKPAPVPEPK